MLFSTQGFPVVVRFKVQEIDCHGEICLGCALPIWGRGNRLLRHVRRYGLTTHAHRVCTDPLLDSLAAVGGA